MKRELIEKISQRLQDEGFSTVECTGSRSCFDILAKRNETLVLVKTLANIEGFNKIVADELKMSAKALKATPIVVGQHMKSHELSDGVVYERYGLIVVNPNTITPLINGSVPGIFAKRGKYCVEVERDMLVKTREALGLTQKMLAELIEVAPHSVYRYEKSGRMSLKIFDRLKEMFPEIQIKSDVLEQHKRKIDEKDYMRNVTKVKHEVVDEMKHLGFDVMLTNAPFDLLAKEDGKIFTVISNDYRRIEKRLETVEEIREMVGGYSICVSSRKVKSDALVMGLKELRELKDTKELYSILRGS